MGQEEYSSWAAGHDQEQVAKALLAWGIVAAADPRFAYMAREGLQERLEAVLANAPGPANDRRWAPAMAWIDPLAVPPRTPDTIAADVPAWAAAYDGAMQRRSTPRVSMTTDGDLSWLTEVIAPVAHTVSYALSPPARPISPWHFPLRVGFLPADTSRRWMQALLERFATSSWQSTLIDPFVLGPARVSCDLLVVDGEPQQLPARLLALPEVRSGSVFITVETIAADVDTTLLAGIAAIASSWAVGCVAVSDVPPWLTDLVQTLSHATPLDVAVSWSTQGAAVLAAHPATLEREVVDQRARRLSKQLRDLGSAGGLLPDEPGALEVAEQLEYIDQYGLFVSEAGDASDLARLEMLAAELIDRSAGARYLQARISPADEPTVSLASFEPGTAHTIEVLVGVPRDGGWLRPDMALPQDQLDPDQPTELTVVLTEPSLLPEPLVQTVLLPPVGDSTSTTFSLVTTSTTTVVDARLIVLSGNRVLQTALLPAEVGRRDEPGRSVSQPELAIAPATSTVAERRTFGAAFVVNRNADGRRRVTAVSHQQAGMVRVDSTTVTQALRMVSTRLRAIVEAPEDYGSLESPESIKVLRFLAFHGAMLRDALVTDTPGLDQILVRPSSAIQVVSAQADAYFPFEFAYEFASPVGPDVRLCPGAVSALQSDVPLCPRLHGPDVVCPSGFWGLHRVIERHAYQPVEQLPVGFQLRSVPNRRRGLIKIGSTIFAASHKVNEVVPGGTQAVANVLSPSWSHAQADLWADWRIAASAATSSGLLLLLPHTTYEPDLQAPGLEIGAGDAAYQFTGCIPSDFPAVVLLLGCDTANVGQLSYEKFPAMFRYAGAEVVIATLTDMLGRHAAPIAGRFVTEIIARCSSESRGIGEVMLGSRRALVADGLLPALALACFGDADWLVAA